MLARIPNSVAVIGLTLISITLPLIGSGCGSRDDAAVSTTPTAAPTTAQVPQAVVSPNEKELAFSDVVPKWKTVSNGQVVHYRFNYTDHDGVGYTCDLPKAMSEGKQMRSAWECTFQAYAVHSEVAPQTVARNVKQVDIGDFPFVSPPSEAAGYNAQANDAQSTTASDAELERRRQELVNQRTEQIIAETPPDARMTPSELIKVQHDAKRQAISEVYGQSGAPLSIGR